MLGLMQNKSASILLKHQQKLLFSFFFVTFETISCVQGVNINSMNKGIGIKYKYDTMEIQYNGPFNIDCAS